jgi:hypothetical protein
MRSNTGGLHDIDRTDQKLVHLPFNFNDASTSRRLHISLVPPYEITYAAERTP